MFSVLIPVQNYNVEPLVAQVFEAAKSFRYAVEIIVRDDGSREKYVAQNKALVAKYGIRHIVSPVDDGRSRNRNELGKAAKYEFLIFIDADSAIPSNYLEEYSRFCQKHPVIIGGTFYSKQPPIPSKLLRWTFGIEREMVDAEDRNADPTGRFTANNLCIRKDIFLRTLFDESIAQYGHEDTLFGIELKKQKVKVYHIDNAVEHLGLEVNEQFIEKTKTGVRTLAYLFNTGKLNPEDVRLLGVYRKLKNFGVGIILNLFGDVLEKRAISQLTSAHPSVRWMDVLKLIELHRSL
jgi:glycosyltransferase involved in cell wall biosynthesis